MPKHNINIQDGFLFQSLKEAVPLEVHLSHGDPIMGRLKRFDRFAIVVDSGSAEVLVYKHAIAFIRPSGG